jgi:hypothetical protein
MSKVTSNRVIEEYAKNIQDFLGVQNAPYSEKQIAEQVFGIKNEDNIPHSKEDLSNLSDLKTALKLLVREKKIVEALIEDPDTQEQLMYYSVSGWYATP